MCDDMSCKDIHTNLKPINNSDYINDTKDCYDMSELLKIFEKAKEKVEKENNRVLLSEVITHKIYND